MMWSTNVENISSRRNSFGLGPHFCQQNKHIPLKKMIIRTTWKAVNCFSNVAHVIYLMVFSFTSTFSSIFIMLVKSVQTSHSRAKWEDYMKAWNYITIDFHQEMGQEYSTIVQIIVKADRGKAIAWRSVSWKMTCYHTSNEKKSLDSQSAFCTHSAVWSRLIRHFRSALILFFPFIRM